MTLANDIAQAAELRRQLAMAEARIADTRNKPLSLADHDAMRGIQVKADAVFKEHGWNAPPPVQGETPLAYRRRLAASLQAHSPTWKKVDMALLPEEGLNVAEVQIYADSVKEARAPSNVPAGTLREIVKKDASGRQISEFRGEPGAWMQVFKAPIRRVTAIHTPAR